MIESVTPILSERELNYRLRETEEARQILEICGNPPLISLSGMEEILMAASKGDCLSASQLDKVKNALVAVKRLMNYLEKGKIYHNALVY